MMRSRAYSFIFAIFLASVSWAQYSLTGTVVDNETRQPIANVEVFNKTQNIKTSTNSRGTFQMKNLKPGHHELVILSFEYESILRQVEIAESTTISIPMKAFQQELSEVLVSEKREEVFALGRLKPVEGTSIYAGKKSEVVLLDQTVGNLASNNARQIYSQVVGLNIYENGDAGLQLNIGGRGLDPNRTSNFNTRQNGYDISADVLGYPESYYTPPAEALEEIQVVRGAASLQYGTQFGGLLNFRMKRPSSEKLAVTLRQSAGSFGLFNSFNSVSGTSGKISYYTYFNYKRGDGFRPNSGFDSKNMFGSFSYQLSDRSKLTAEVTWLRYLAQQAGGLTDTQFERDITFSNRYRNWFEVNWKLYALKFEHKFSTASNLSVSLFGLDAGRDALGFRGSPLQEDADNVLINDNANVITQEDETNGEGSFAFYRDIISDRFRNWGAEVKFLTRYQLGEKDAVLLLGTKLYRSSNTSRQGPGSKGSDADFSFVDELETYPSQSSFQFPNANLAFFGEHIFFVNPQLSITPGFRLEHIKTESSGSYTLPNIGSLSGNIDGIERLRDDRSLTRNFLLLGVGVSYEASNNLELYGNVSENYRSVTFSDIRVTNPSFIIDPDISDESGYSFDVGARGKLDSFLSYDFSIFGLLYNDRIGIVFDDRANRVRKNIGDALVYGLESFAELDLLELLDAGTGKYRLGWFVNTALTGSSYLRSEEANVKGKKVEFVPVLNLKTGFRFGYQNLLGNVMLTHLSEQFTDVENSPVATENSSREGLVGEIPSFSVIDISFSYKIRKQWKIETGINNLTKTKYFTRRATGYPGPGIIPSEPRSGYVTLQFSF